MEPDKKVSPRELAEQIERRYGTPLSSQQALVFHLFIYADAFITYSEIENRLWSEEKIPLSARRMVHVAVTMLRRKIPPFIAECNPGYGYDCKMSIADVYPDETSQGN